MDAASQRLEEVGRALGALSGVRLWRRAPLAPFTTIGVGGRGALLAAVCTTGAASAVLRIVTDAGVPGAVLGAGSNTLVADNGYAGVLLKLDDAFQFVEGPFPGIAPREVDVVVGAAVSLPRLAAFLADRGLAGLEFACGIPGTVGGGVAMNAGAHGGCIAEAVRAVELTLPGETRWVAAEALEWEYRKCRLPEGAVVTAVRLGLVLGDRSRIFAQHRALLRHRRQTQPRGVRTFGSVFKNPPGDAAGRLLEAAGLKGLRRGGAQVSPVHANFLTNVGEATAADVLGLMTMMREAVEARGGPLLEPEVRLLGGRFPWDCSEREGKGPPAAHG